jgi:AraC-like DNA-binding protein
VEPQPPLSEFVERLWLAIDGQVPRKERILPNGTVELVVNLREDRVRIDGVGDTACHKSVAGVAVSGAYSKVFIIDAMQHEAMLGVHFRPGGASVVLGVPSGELTNAHADLAGLWGAAAARTLRERLCTAVTHRQRFRILEHALTQRLAAPLRRSPAVRLALDLMGPHGAGASIREIVRQTGLSHRRLVTLFTNEVGLSPKVFCRILRFQHVHALAQRTGRPEWAQVALACGFFDQAHLSNEFRKLSGLSPKEYERDIQETRNLLRGHVAIP